MAVNSTRVFDSSKENILPPKRRIEAPALKSNLQTENVSQVWQRLLKERRQLEHSISIYEGDDPLDLYCDYFTWLEQNVAILGTNSYIRLLEDIIIKFKDWETYKQDARFIQLIIKYISTQPNPLELYELVYGQSLGTKCSALFLAWAARCEILQEFKEADRIYLLGIKCQAQPLEVLKDAHIQFQLKIARKMLEGNSSVLLSANNDPEEDLFKNHSSKNGRNVIKQCSKGTASSYSNKHHSLSSNTYKFKIYEDKNNGHVCDSRKRERSSKDDMITCTHTQTIVKCYDLKKKTSRESVSNQIAASVNKEVTQINESVKAVVKFGTLKPKKKDDFKCPVAIFELDDPAKKSMYPKHLVYADGGDLQLEEIRAMHYYRKIRKLTYSTDILEKTAETEAENFENIPLEPVNLTKSYNPSLEQKQDSFVVGNKSKVKFRSTGSRKSGSFSYDALLGTQFVEPVIRSNSDNGTKWCLPDTAYASLNVAGNREQNVKDVHAKRSPRCEYKNNFYFESANSENFKAPAEICQKDVTQSNEGFSPPRILPVAWIQEKFENSKKVQKELEDSVDFRSGDNNTSTFHQSPSTSFTVNTRAAWNVIQKMWESPLGPPHSAIATDYAEEDFGNPVFKKPLSRTPRRKISFPTFSDDEMNFEKNNCGVRSSKTSKLPCFPEKPTFTPHFPTLADNNTDLGFESNAPRMGPTINYENTRRISDAYSTDWKGHSCVDSENLDIKFAISYLPIGTDLTDRMSDLKMKGKNKEQGMLLPLIVPAKLSNSPLKESEDKENQAPKDYFTPPERRPVGGILTPAIDIPVREIDRDDSDEEENDDVDYLISERNRLVDEDTCNTRAFGFFLPSSTPFLRAESLRSSVYNGSYILEDSLAVGNSLPPVSNTIADNPKKFSEKSTANLSLILENSKEQGSSSSSGGANLGTRNFF